MRYAFFSKRVNCDVDFAADDEKFVVVRDARLRVLHLGRAGTPVCLYELERRPIDLNHLYCIFQKKQFRFDSNRSCTSDVFCCICEIHIG